MATQSPLDTLQREVSCSICLGYFQDPVSIPCGHNFCRQCITRCWEGLEADFPCPQCRKTSAHKTFRPSRELSNIAGIARQLSSRSSGQCQQHREAPKLFCKDDQEPICARCDVSRAHRSHTVLPAHRAAQEYKEEIQARLQASKEEREKYLESRKAGGRTNLYLEKTKKEGKRIVCEFEQLQRFLKEQERFLLVQLADLDRAVTKVQEDAVTKVLEELSHLDTLIWEMEGKFQQPDSKFLLDIRRLLNSCETMKFSPPEEISPHLERKLEDFLQKNALVRCTLRKCQDSLMFQLQEPVSPHLPPNPTPAGFILKEKRQKPQGDIPQHPPGVRNWKRNKGQPQSSQHTWPRVSPGADLQAQRIHPRLGRNRKGEPQPHQRAESNRFCRFTRVEIQTDIRFSEGGERRSPRKRSALECRNLEDLLEDLKNEIEKRQKSTAKLSEEISPLDTKAKGEKSQQSDVKSSISRCGKVTFQLPAGVSPEPEERVCHFPWRNGALKDTLKKLQASITLDPDTAHPDLVLSEDQKSVKRGEGRQELPDNPERFSYWPFVLGHQSFMAGRHCWEVEVGDEGDWAIGVARESIPRKGQLSLCPKGGIWGVEKWGGQVRALTTHKVTLLTLRWVPRRVSVHLDYAGGTVTFFDADEGGLIFVFSHASFAGERIRPWLWVVGARSKLRLCP